MANTNGRSTPAWVWPVVFTAFFGLLGLLYTDTREIATTARDSSASLRSQFIEVKSQMVPKLDEILRRLDRMDREAPSARPRVGGR